jgi:cytochrome c-type biogenesis protein CcmH/NrfF
LPERVPAVLKTVALLALLLLSPGAPAQEEGDIPGHVILEGPVERSIHPEARTAAEEIRCDCGCPPQSVWDCNCGRAAELRGLMDDEAQGGRSGEEIVAGYVEREGIAILMAPPMEGFNLTGWFGPGLATLAALVALALALLAWRRRGERAAAARAAGPDLDPAYRERIARDLDRFDREGSI